MITKKLILNNVSPKARQNIVMSNVLPAYFNIPPAIIVSTGFMKTDPGTYNDSFLIPEGVTILGIVQSKVLGIHYALYHHTADDLLFLAPAMFLNAGLENTMENAEGFLVGAIKEKEFSSKAGNYLLEETDGLSIAGIVDANIESVSVVTVAMNDPSMLPIDRASINTNNEFSVNGNKLFIKVTLTSPLDVDDLITGSFWSLRNSGNKGLVSVSTGVITTNSFYIPVPE